MNAELIKKYKKEFDHLLNGGSVLSRYGNHKEWRKCDTSDLSLWGCDIEKEPVIFIIDDEYIEFRKALAEGKTIQYSKDGRYIDIKILNPSVFDKPKDYSIKPDEPEFKVGDWVIEIHNNEIHQVLELHKDVIKIKTSNGNTYTASYEEFESLINKLPIHLKDI